MKLPYIAVVLGIILGIAGVMLIPAATDAGRALIFLICMLVVATLLYVGNAIAERWKKKPE